jgi:iron complex outermembrane receptor protein
LEQGIEESGRNVKVITRKELLNSNVRSIDEAIQLLGGIEVQTRGAFGSQADFSIQGSTFGQVKVLVDGQPINDPLTGHYNSNIPVNFYDIEQIEIVKGPSSAIYGPDAVGGVINIVTNSFQGKSKGFNINGGYGFGEHDLRTFDVGGQLRIAGIAGSIQYSKTKTDGPEYAMDSTSQYARISTLTSGLGYNKGKWQVQTRASWDKRDFDARYYYTRSSFDRSTEKVDRLWLQGLLKYTIDSTNKIQLNVSQIQTDDEFLFNPAFSLNEHSTKRSDMRLEWKSSWSRKIKSLVGVNYNLRSIESNDRGDHDDERLGFFILGEYQVNEKWVISPSLRIDNEDEYDSEINPQLAISYGSGPWSARIFSGRSIRTADYTERYVNFGRTSTLSAGRNLGNPLLTPEKAWTFEMGAGYQPVNNFSFNANVFLRNSEDLIDYILTPTSEIADSHFLEPNGQYFYAQNISDLKTNGIELSSYYAWSIANEVKCEVNLNYSWINSDSDEEVVSKYIANHSHHFINWNLSADYQQMRFSINGLYKSRTGDTAQDINAELVNEYHVINMRMSLGILGEGIKLYAQVHNVLDTEYSDILGAQLPGRWWSGGLRFNWK